MLCVGPSPSESHELQEEEVRTYQPAAPEEEAQIDGSPAAWSGVGVCKVPSSQDLQTQRRRCIACCCNRRISRS